MKNSGYIYVLVNQSLPGCVKIGKTRRDATMRAAELSQATGVPTPFIVAYEAFFDDCDYAESYIHALLESTGVRLSQNREFFTLSASDAINAIIRAQSQIESFGDCSSDAGGYEMFTGDSESFDNNISEAWDDLLYEAECYLYGYDDEPENPKKAIELFKMAAKLGSPDAYIHLAEIHSDMYGESKGIEWLRSGAEKGIPECWIELARVYAGLNVYFGSQLYSIENSIKCYRRFFRLIDPSSFDPEGHKIYAFLSRYVDLLGNNWSSADEELVRDFSSSFKACIIENSISENEKNTKLGELSLLIRNRL